MEVVSHGLLLFIFASSMALWLTAVVLHFEFFTNKVVSFFLGIAACPSHRLTT